MTNGAADPVLRELIPPSRNAQRDRLAADRHRHAADVGMTSFSLIAKPSPRIRCSSRSNPVGEPRVDEVGCGIPAAVTMATTVSSTSWDATALPTAVGVQHPTIANLEVPVGPRKRGRAPHRNRIPVPSSAAASMLTGISLLNHSGHHRASDGDEPLQSTRADRLVAGKRRTEPVSDAVVGSHDVTASLERSEISERGTLREVTRQPEYSHDDDVHVQSAV